METNKTTRGKKLTEIQKAYLAGFIDGEGCINLYRTFPNKNMRYEMSLSLYNTHKETMEYLASIIDGAILQTKSMKKRPSHWKQSYVIKLSSHPSLKLLKQVERYMFTKKKQAELAILFQETKLKKENRFAPLKEHEVIFQDECWKNMSLLNTNGHKKYSGFLYKNHPQRLTEKKPEKVK